nr:MAG TPA: tail sheath protein [Caudoviricetes sp.]
MAQLPRVKITFAEGNLGKVGDSPDGLVALMVSATAVGDTFELGKPYSIHSVDDLKALKVNDKNNAVLVKHVREFFAEAGKGTEVYIYGVDKAKTMTELCTKGASDDEAGELLKLITLCKGRLRAVAIALDAQDEPEATEGIVADVLSAIPKAQETAEYATVELFAPLFVILEGRGYKRQGLKDITELGCNRVSVFVGETRAEGKGAAVGLLAGRIAKVAVQRNVGRVLDGKIATDTLYLGGQPLETQTGAVADLYTRGYICPRQFVGRVGFFFCDDRLATSESDDYAHITARRTIDKAYRIAYDTLLNFNLDELDLQEDGTLHPAEVRSWEEQVTSAIDRAMTDKKELSADESTGRGCRFEIIPTNILSTSKVVGKISVRPFGYARYIDAEIGFTAVTTK